MHTNNTLTRNGFYRLAPPSQTSKSIHNGAGVHVHPNLTMMMHENLKSEKFGGLISLYQFDMVWLCVVGCDLQAQPTRPLLRHLACSKPLRFTLFLPTPFTNWQVEKHLGRATQNGNAGSCGIMQRWVVSVTWGVEPCKVRRLIAPMVGHNVGCTVNEFANGLTMEYLCQDMTGIDRCTVYKCTL